MNTKFLFILVLVFSLEIMHAQVGIGTTEPNASLDIASSSLTNPSNTDGLLIPKIDNFPSTNPGIDQDGMMVFVTGNGVPAKGFYYWNNGTTTWVSVIGVDTKNTLDEAYDEGGAGAGRIITADNGAIEIQNTGGLRVEGDISAAANIVHDGDTDTFLNFSNDRVLLNAGGTNYIDIRNSDNTVNFNENGTSVDLRVESDNETHMLFVDGSTDRIGINRNNPLSTLHVAGNMDGTGSAVQIDAGDTQDGINISMNGSSSTALDNTDGIIITHNVGFTGSNARPSGMTISMNGSTTETSSSIRGVDISFNGPSNYLGNVYGSQILDLSAADNTFYGYLVSAGSTGIHPTYGSYNAVGATGTGNIYGSFNTLTGLGTGDKYGTYNFINSGGGGTHYGTYSDVQSTTGYAGYFIGRTSLGDGLSNRYIMPATDGTSGQVMTTDGTGNISFQNQTMGAQQINDLTDGKSDNDGTDDGSSIFLGINAGANDDSTHNFNVGIGFEALQSNISSWGNTAVGHRAMQMNTSGMNNTATGAFSLLDNISGVDNAAFGNATLASNTSGSFNSAIGFGALNSNTIGTSNTALGYWSLLNNDSGAQNVALGAGSGYTNSTGDSNVFIGYQSGYFETGSDKLYIENSNVDSNNALIYGEFDNNILRTNSEFQIGNPAATGYSFPITDGTSDQVITTDGSGQLSFVDTNTIFTDTDNQNLSTATLTGTTLNLGIQNGTGTSVNLASLQDGTGNDWSLTGNNAFSTNFIGTTNNLDLPFRSSNTEYMRLSTTGQLEFINTFESIRIGQFAGEGPGGAGISRNVFIGHEAARFQGVVSLDNIGIGHEALRSVSGSSNIAIGARALRNTTSSQNTAIGHIALTNNSTGTGNTALGYASLGNNDTGENNVTIGAISGRLNVSGSNNTYLGFSSGYNSTGNNNVFIGYNSGRDELGSNKLYVENSNADADNALIYGEFDNNILRANGELQIGNPAGTGYAFPSLDGTTGQILTTDGAGNVTFQDSFNEDSDWYEVGSTNPPNSLNDDKYTGGSLSIGKNTTAIGMVDIENNNKITTLSLVNTYDPPSSSSPKYGIQNSINSTEQNTAIQNELLGNSSSKTGVSNFFSGNMTVGLVTGVSNRFETTGNNNQIAIYNTFASTLSTGTTITGLRNWFQNGSNYTGPISGIKNDFNNDNNGEHTAILNTFTGTGTGVKYGVKTIYSGNGNGIFYGNYTELSNTGSGNKYGNFISILNTSGGIHYGIYSDVQNPIGYAGYFIGRTSLGNSAINRYLMPAADGSNGQVMTTDGSGNVTFQNPNTGTDNQQIDTFSFNPSTNELTLELEDDGQPAQVVNLSNLNPQKAIARLFMSASQTETGSGLSKVNFDSTEFDIGNNFNTTTDEFIVPQTGIYRVTTQITMDASTGTGVFDVRIRVNSTQQRRAEYNHTGNGLILRQITSILSLTAGDSIDIAFSRPAIGATIQANSRASFFEVEQLQ